MKHETQTATQPKIQRVQSGDLQLAFIGERWPGGSYVLRFHVAERLVIPCGRFDKGKPVTFEPGNYLYVGSGMAKRGPSSLAGRLTRHASRLYNRPPHAIRAFMMAQFPSFGLGHYEPDGMKNPKWNVDWPLNQTCVTLTAAYAISTLWEIEGHLAKFLENDDATVVFKRRLGGNDFKDTTHVLRVDADETWWDQLPEKLAAFLPRGEELAKLTQRLGKEVVTPTAGSRLSDAVLKYLRGRWHERAAAIVILINAGQSFKDARTNTEHIYDTTRTEKVSSRLSRGRGSVLIAAETLQARWEGLITKRQHQTRLIDFGEELLQGVRELRQMINNIAVTPRSQPAKMPPASEDWSPSTFAQVKGCLTACRRFIRKNINDVPLLENRLHESLSENQLSASLNELNWIESAVGQILETCRNRSLEGRATVETVES
jgi:Uri superfamily endonuclease